MVPEKFKEWAFEELREVRKAKVAFALAAALSASAGWIIAGWFYSQELRNKDSLIQLKDQQLQALQPRPAAAVEPLPSRPPVSEPAVRPIEPAPTGSTETKRAAASVVATGRRGDAPTGQQKPPESKPSISVEQNTAGGPAGFTLGPNSPLTINPEVNPNAPLVTYDYNGVKRISSRPGHLDAEIGPLVTAFDELVRLRSASKWRDLLLASEPLMKSDPDWLTPYFFAGVARYGIATEVPTVAEHDREIAAAVEMLRLVERRSGGNKQWEEATKLLGDLRRRGLVK